MYVRVCSSLCYKSFSFCCCLAIRLYTYIYIRTNLLPLASAQAVLAEEDLSCNSRGLGVPVHCAACYSSSSRLRLSFLRLSLVCSRVASWIARFSFLKANLKYFFRRRDLTPTPTVTNSYHDLTSSPPLSPLNASYFHVCMYVCVCMYVYTCLYLSLHICKKII